MSFSKSHFCTLQLGPVLTIRHNLWTPLGWPNKRKQQEQTLTGDKTRTRHNLARQSIHFRDHSSHLTPYLKPTKAARKHANSLQQLAIKHTLPVTATGWAGGTCTSQSSLTALSSALPRPGSALDWPLLTPQVLTQIGSQTNTGVLPVIFCRGSLLIFFGELTTLSHYFTFYCGLSWQSVRSQRVESIYTLVPGQSNLLPQCLACGWHLILAKQMNLYF